tara:strand:- start:6 stop:566 length:561 start_codon:yes stop_codon:yes gene_type:complete
MKKLLSILVLSLLFGGSAYAENKNENITYKLVSNQVLDEICSNKYGCKNTVKKELLSNDGFVFETYTTNDTDAVWCLPYSDENRPCSTIGDSGAGKNEMIIYDVTNSKKAKIINNSHSGRITRLNTSPEFKYIIMEIYSGGASCCSKTELYSKQDVSLEPFVIDETMGSFLINENKDLIENHFKMQ